MRTFRNSRDWIRIGSGTDPYWIRNGSGYGPDRSRPLPTAPDRFRPLPPDSPALHLIQQVRDEAHRFAITGHRAKRGKARTQSRLDGIEGLGPTRRRALLQHFGGVTQIKAASVDAIAEVNGISRTLAQRIHDQLR